MSEQYAAGDVYYFPAINEAGWRDSRQQELGFRPDLDREFISLKVAGILNDLHNQQWLYISNGTQGEVISENVAARCEEEGRFDQESILRFILEEPNTRVESHALFWKEESRKWLDGPSAADEMNDALAKGQTARLI